MTSELGRSERRGFADPERQPEANEALDGVLQALEKHGFCLPCLPAARQRDALADALVYAAIEHEIRIRIDRNEDC